MNCIQFFKDWRYVEGPTYTLLAHQTMLMNRFKAILVKLPSSPKLLT